MLKWAKKFWNDEQGLELSEYAVMLALIVVALFVAITALREAIIKQFNATAGKIDAAS
jgi:Flp pilus assembly pilin Flp